MTTKRIEDTKLLDHLMAMCFFLVGLLFAYAIGQSSNYLVIVLVLSIIIMIIAFFIGV